MNQIMLDQIMLGRRQFLQAGGALIVGFALAPAIALAAEQTYPLRDVAADSVDSFLVIAENGEVTLYSGKVDMGTGARVAFRQIVAEELDVPVARIAMIEGDTALCPDQGGTGGSTGIVGGGMQIRQAAANARARRCSPWRRKVLNAPTEELTVTDGVVARQATGAAFPMAS